MRPDQHPQDTGSASGYLLPHRLELGRWGGERALATERIPTRPLTFTPWGHGLSVAQWRGLVKLNIESKVLKIAEDSSVSMQRPWLAGAARRLTQERKTDGKESASASDFGFRNRQGATAFVRALQPLYHLISGAAFHHPGSKLCLFGGDPALDWPGSVGLWGFIRTGRLLPDRDCWASAPCVCLVKKSPSCTLDCDVATFAPLGIRGTSRVTDHFLN